MLLYVMMMMMTVELWCGHHRHLQDKLVEERQEKKNHILQQKICEPDLPLERYMIKIYI